MAAISVIEATTIFTLSLTRHFFAVILPLSITDEDVFITY